jgi:YesN/AraC family two-component response regulator
MKETIDFKQKFLPEYDFFEFLDPESKVKLLIQEACRTVTEGKPGFLRAMKVQSILLEVIYMLLQSEQVEGNLYTVEHDEYITDFTSRVNGYMREHLAEKLSVKKLAQYMHVSEAQMFKRYKKETGLSPMKQLTLMRVDKAKSLVMQGIPLDYTAVQTGFYDAFHLSKTFKKFEGFSPREYIKNLSGQH